MTDLTHVPDNVWDFINKASDDYGRFEAERFSQEVFSRIVEEPIASPIEQIFYVALRTFAHALYEEIDPESIEIGGQLLLGHGIHIVPQFKVGNYRVDFLVERTWIYRQEQHQCTVLVELDGHEFHDRDKRQRAYEKARDRFIQRAGYRILHYTGSEVVGDPYRVAHEVLNTIEAASGAYDPKNPFGID